MSSKANVVNLYPPIEPFDTGFLTVSSIHTLYFEQCGNKNGCAVIFLHGGPGGGPTPGNRRFFDPQAYRVVLLHQRGSGRSTPSAELRENTTWDMVQDIEKLREHLGIEKWAVFGGSWGSTLALAYAQTHPGRVKALILRGIFTMRRFEQEWLYEGKGANFIFPESWDAFVGFIPEGERGSLIDAYYRRLSSEDEDVRQQAANRWVAWESTLGFLIPSPETLQRPEPERILQRAKLCCHYCVHGGFFSPPSQLLDNVDKIRHIPCSIVHGRYDVVCPIGTAWDLHKRWPEAEFVISPDAGHNLMERTTASHLIKFCDKYKCL